MQHSTPSLVERRSSERYEVSLKGELIWDGGRQRCPCSIVDMSVDGACVETGFRIALPKRPILFNHETGDAFECEVRWQRGSQTGVYFMDVCSRAARKTILAKYSR